MSSMDDGHFRASWKTAMLPAILLLSFGLCTSTAFADDCVSEPGTASDPARTTCLGQDGNFRDETLPSVDASSNETDSEAALEGNTDLEESKPAADDLKSTEIIAVQQPECGDPTEGSSDGSSEHHSNGRIEPVPGNEESIENAQLTAGASDEAIGDDKAISCGIGSVSDDIVLDPAATAKKGIWVSTSKGYRYRYSDGSWAWFEWVTDNGKRYYFDIDGYMQTGWVDYDGHRYYLGKDGARQAGKWLSLSGRWYYLTKYGAAAVGERSIGGKSYLFSKKDAHMLTGWQRVGARSRYYGADGALRKNCWVKSSGKWYYANSLGNKSIGRKAISGKTYWFSRTDGHMYTGWKKLSGNRYYFGSDGAMRKSQWKKSGGYWYYLKSNGAVATGVKYINGVVYSFSTSTGRMLASSKALSSRYVVTGNTNWTETVYLFPDGTVRGRLDGGFISSEYYYKRYKCLYSGKFSNIKLNSNGSITMRVSNLTFPKPEDIMDPNAGTVLGNYRFYNSSPVAFRHNDTVVLLPKGTYVANYDQRCISWIKGLNGIANGRLKVDAIFNVSKGVAALAL